MFQTDLLGEYQQALRTGLTPAEVARIAQMGFEYSFLASEEKQSLIETFRTQRRLLRLI
jgi:adenosine deaminase